MFFGEVYKPRQQSILVNNSASMPRTKEIIKTPANVFIQEELHFKSIHIHRVHTNPYCSTTIQDVNEPAFCNIYYEKKNIIRKFYPFLSFRRRVENINGIQRNTCYKELKRLFNSSEKGMSIRRLPAKYLIIINK